jgi:hypothetical protein
MEMTNTVKARKQRLTMMSTTVISTTNKGSDTDKSRIMDENDIGNDADDK